ncbi:hypothetical protein [Fluviibacter phosphoraccumulans]|uniref:hypothetical protein n=1 Tax=Fluviibacter phosphoraccumulans TaxID=1751046 RepID=UPI0024E203C3|nr:hypothetical protein [Fluviibacter phosphoraccumulans]
MDLWATRTEFLAYLENQCAERLAVLLNVFALIDETIAAFEAIAGADVYARIFGLNLLKAKHLAVGAYSLILDGLGQESGALLRPFIEYAELLTYFRKFPDKAAQAAEDKLPKAGERARAIGGIYKDFREYLNSHASHSSYSHYSLSHLLEPRTNRFKKLQRAVPLVLETNVRDFAIQLYLLLHEAVLALERLKTSSFESLAARTDLLKEELFHAFKLSAA